mmetsp:Transcript_72008/g.203366  ORF Transcript_72008/g.203366 Transcript_72008/m.203366 type:complete len:92 (+) Transcript_72008:313-588(+)
MLIVTVQTLDRKNEVEHLFHHVFQRLLMGITCWRSIAEHVHDLFRRVCFSQDHLARVLLEEQASKRIEQLGDDVAVFMLLCEEVWEDEGDL